MIVSLVFMSIIPQPDMTVDCCDMIEINHVYRVVVVMDPPITPKPRVTPQAIYVNFYDWSPRRQAYVCIAWVVWNRQYPMHRGNRWFYHFHDGQRFREVSAAIFRETWTAWDNEVENRKIMDASLRRGLTP